MFSPIKSSSQLLENTTVTSVLFAFNIFNILMIIYWTLFDLKHWHNGDWQYND